MNVLNPFNKLIPGIVCCLCMAVTYACGDQNGGG